MKQFYRDLEAFTSSLALNPALTDEQKRAKMFAWMETEAAKTGDPEIIESVAKAKTKLSTIQKRVEMADDLIDKAMLLAGKGNLPGMLCIYTDEIRKLLVDHQIDPYEAKIMVEKMILQMTAGMVKHTLPLHGEIWAAVSRTLAFGYHLDRQAKQEDEALREKQFFEGDLKARRLWFFTNWADNTFAVLLGAILICQANANLLADRWTETANCFEDEWVELVKSFDEVAKSRGVPPVMAMADRTRAYRGMIGMLVALGIPGIKDEEKLLVEMQADKQIPEGMMDLMVCQLAADTVALQQVLHDLADEAEQLGVPETSSPN
jgi:hypothetical protein